MTARAQAFDVRDFTYLFFAVMDMSEKDKSFDHNALRPWCMDLFNDDRSKTDAFITRFLALVNLIEHDRAKPYIELHEGRTRLHPALFEVAATLRMRKNGSFPDRRFFDDVEQIADIRYADFNFDA